MLKTEVNTLVKKGIHNDTTYNDIKKSKDF